MGIRSRKAKLTAQQKYEARELAKKLTKHINRAQIDIAAARRTLIALIQNPYLEVLQKTYGESKETKRLKKR